MLVNCIHRIVTYIQEVSTISANMSSYDELRLDGKLSEIDFFHLIKFLNF